MNFREMTIYQIYPRSFYDSNGDGIGDLAGITAKLGYLKELGVDMVWITPFFESPQNDNGYDVSDYYTIDPIFGTMSDFEELIAKGKALGIEFMLDMVFNHTSTDHRWFKEAITGNQYMQNFYIFKDGATLPSNWQSKFGGSAWKYIASIDKQYLHLFDQSQADLNWENPAVREELINVINFWMNKGVMGLRFDVINLIAKGEITNDPTGDGRTFYTDQPAVLGYLQELNQKSFGKSTSMVTVGELSSATIDAAISYTQPQSQALSMIFNFHHLKVDYQDGDKWSLMQYDFMKLKEIFFTWQLAMQKSGGWQALFWSNHDQPRALSRFGNVHPTYRTISAKMLANALYCMRGTPFIYQGEEIGMINANFTKLADYRDVESLNYYNILENQGKHPKEILAILGAKSRDHGRTPIPWKSNSPHAGFTTGEPWINLIDAYHEINIESSIADSQSIFHHYKKLIEFRKASKAVSDGNIIPHLAEHPELLVYERFCNGEHLLVIANFFANIIELDLGHIADGIFASAKVILHNYENVHLSGTILHLSAYESLVLWIQ